MLRLFRAPPKLGAYRLRQEPAKNDFRYICVGSLDDPEALPPKGEFFCKSRASWMPEVPGMDNSSPGCEAMMADAMRL